MKSKRKLRILLLMGRHTPRDKTLLGITAYAAQHTQWVLDMANPTPTVVSNALRKRRWDGVIGHMNWRETYRSVAALGTPAVNCSGDLPAEKMPEMAHTTTDNDGAVCRRQYGLTGLCKGGSASLPAMRSRIGRGWKGGTR